MAWSSTWNQSTRQLACKTSLWIPVCRHSRTRNQANHSETPVWRWVQSLAFHQSSSRSLTRWCIRWTNSLSKPTLSQKVCSDIWWSLTKNYNKSTKNNRKYTSSSNCSRSSSSCASSNCNNNNHSSREICQDRPCKVSRRQLLRQTSSIWERKPVRNSRMLESSCGAILTKDKISEMKLIEDSKFNF